MLPRLDLSMYSQSATSRCQGFLCSAVRGPQIRQQKSLKEKLVGLEPFCLWFPVWIGRSGVRPVLRGAGLKVTSREKWRDVPAPGNC